MWRDICSELRKCFHVPVAFVPLVRIATSFPLEREILELCVGSIEFCRPSDHSAY